MPDWLVSVCAGRWQLQAIQEASELGAHVFAIDGDSSAPGLQLADHAAVVDITDPDAVVDAIRSAGVHPRGVVCAIAEAGQRAAAAVREEFELPGADTATVRALTDKSVQRRIWSDAGLPCPKWHVFDSVSHATRFGAKVFDCLPVIVKPTDSAGSRGITVVHDHRGMAYAADKALSASKSGRALVEQFVDGEEFAIETFGVGGDHEVLAITCKRKVPGTSQTVALELSTPDHSADIVGEIGALAVDALTAIGYREGPGHTEVLRSQDGALTLVEAAGRGGGFMVAEGLVPLASDFPLARATVRVALGYPVRLNVSVRRPVVLRFLPSSKGIVKSISGLQEAGAVPGVEVGPLVTVGDRVGGATTDADRLCYVLATGQSLREARDRADEAEAILRVEVSPD